MIRGIAIVDPKSVAFTTQPRLTHFVLTIDIICILNNSLYRNVSWNEECVPYNFNTKLVLHNIPTVIQGLEMK